MGNLTGTGPAEYRVEVEAYAAVGDLVAAAGPILVVFVLALELEGRDLDYLDLVDWP